MAYSTISKPSLHFNTKLYTGNGSTQALTGVGFQPDWTWIKERGASNNHELYDAVRGVTKRIYSDLANVEDTNSTGLTAFGTDGFTLGGAGGTNNNSDTYASWNWKAGGGQGSSNTDGSINTTYTSANTTAGFSISSYTGTGSNATIGHGLGVAPRMIIVKDLSDTSNWGVYHKAFGATKYIDLNQTNAEATSNLLWNDTEPTSSVFSVGTNGRVNTSGRNYIAYCFAEKKGYSKFGSYTGNGNTDGAFVYTGFKPAWFMQKRIDATNGWHIFDIKRDTYNVSGKYLVANQSDAEASASSYLDILSNGIKMRRNGADVNASGGSYIYMCFAEAPLVGNNNVPCTAR